MCQWTGSGNGLAPVQHQAIHDDVVKWKHFSRYWPFVRGIPRSSGSFDVLVSNRQAGDLDAIVPITTSL